MHLLLHLLHTLEAQKTREVDQWFEAVKETRSINPLGDPGYKDINKTQRPQSF